MAFYDDYHDVPCPKCHAPKGQPCTGFGNVKLIAIHDARYLKGAKKRLAESRRDPTIARLLKENQMLTQAFKKLDMAGWTRNGRRVKRRA